MAPKVDDRAAICFCQANPKRRGTKAYDRYEGYKKAATVEEALRLGALKGDITNDLKQGFCAMRAPGDESAPAPAPSEPQPSRKRAASAAVGSEEGGCPKRPAAPASPASSSSNGVPAAAAPSAASNAGLATNAFAAPAAMEASTLRAVDSPTPAAIVGMAATLASKVDLSFAKLEGKPIKYVKRTMGEARRLLCPEGVSEGKKCGYEFSLRDRDNLSKWLVKLRDLNPDGQLAKELSRRKLEISVDLEITLPDGFPLEPPFARVVYPQLTGGYVFTHGGICFEPLTAKGWVPSMTLPALAIAIKGILDFGDVKFAGAGDVNTRTVPQYTEAGARKDHSHIVAAHRGGESQSYGSLDRYKS